VIDLGAPHITLHDANSGHDLEPYPDADVADRQADDRADPGDAP
jgi:hypothetical protein